MASTQKSGKGLLVGDEDQQAASAGGVNSNTTSGGGIASPFAGVTPALLGGASGVQALPYGGAQAAVTRQYAFNPKYAAMDQAIQRAIANAGFDRTNALSTLEQGYNQQTSEAARQNDMAQHNLTDRFAGQGLGFSGIRLGAANDLTNDYQRYIGSLGQQFAGGKANVENQYGRQLGDFAAQRESLFAQQGEEEHQAQLEAARQRAEAEARQQAAAQQAALQQQLIQQQQQAYQQQLAYQQQQALQTPNIQSIGAPSAGAAGYQGGANGIGAANGQNWDQIMALINSSNDRTSLAGFGGVPGLPQQVMDALNARIEMLNGAARNTIVPGSHSGNVRFY